MQEETLLDKYRVLWRSRDWHDRPALLSEDTALTYGELAARVDALAADLIARGIEPGDTVALSMARTGDSVVVLLAILQAGGCLCPMEPRTSPEEMADRLRRLRCRWVVTDETQAHQFADAPHDCTVLDRSRLSGDRGRTEPGSPVTADSPALILFTSGSTGQPKALQLTHRALSCNALGVVRHTALTPDDRLLHIMPIYHTNGINNQILTPLLSGCSIAFTPRFKAENVPGLMERYRPTIITGVPTMYSRMLAHDFPAAALAALRMVRCGSAPITVDLQERMEALFGCPVVVSYGLSEATCTSTMNPPERRRIGSVGTVLDGQTVALLQVDGDVPVAPGQEGEISIAGPALMSGYLDEKGIPCRDDIASGWFRTGDLGRFDEDGYLSITGRIKNVIIRGGENIAPELIERVLIADPSIDACCVVGKPDPDLGEVPVAFVVPNADHDIDTVRLMNLVSQRLSRSHQPAWIIAIGELPESAMGKVDRKALARRLAEPAGATP
ncbi:class I adenylate-forming enzyme family protein [Halomonas sp. HP20-15]|uniref:class I adenylate-forming enzyme family protein n=1 Tax=Halomonas sp. HP20-15 TaxID=3085901 RepID=UPI002982A92E|nr:class I adenylate-forming enzyme family protein [Halomonas sp. HP20-15]MDW5377760.1 class I adenylate-forming enzyme family protein [Halomonas sp. HP20-15]